MSGRVVFSLTVDQVIALDQLAQGKKPSPFSTRVMTALCDKGLIGVTIYDPELTPLGEVAAQLAQRLASRKGR